MERDITLIFMHKALADISVYVLNDAFKINRKTLENNYNYYGLL